MAPSKTIRRSRSGCRSAGRKRGDEPLAGYRLLEPLGSGGFGEVWKCEAPGGLLKAIKFVRGGLKAIHGSTSAEEELQAIQRVRAIRHPFLLSIERVEHVNNSLIIVTELADKNLDALFQECRRAGQSGIPREKLVAYLREAAEALDVLNVRHDLLHLDVKPRNLFLVGDHVKVGDFGLVNALEASNRFSRPIHLESLTPLYAAPELLQGHISRTCDQYSLAIAFQELLTGTLPFRGDNARQLLLVRHQAEPDLHALHPLDRTVVARALDRDPAKRFPSCAAFIRSLAPSRAVAMVPAQVLSNSVGIPDLEPRMTADGTGIEWTHFSSLPLALLELRLEGFRRRWGGQPLSKVEREFSFEVQTPRSFWERWLGRRPGLEVKIRLVPPATPGDGEVEVRARVYPRSLSRSQGFESLQVIGLLLLENLRSQLQAVPRRRSQERLIWSHEFEARPVQPLGGFGSSLRCRGCDISMSGIGFLAPCELPTTQILLKLPPTPQTQPVELTARVVRSQRREDGWWEVGAVLLSPVRSPATKYPSERSLQGGS